ncbi:hypothetical protein E3N88_17961 [Mikania micrantha]|uniref:Uncharacterized protein n=1 Tax=Mikania micrantha TaxID=192012 RepID=A0A5N6NVJ5_9ASTR|nr:hypothetical protein E3N88_17961 [Mikania micrantha]
MEMVPCEALLRPNDTLRWPKGHIFGTCSFGKTTSSFDHLTFAGLEPWFIRPSYSHHLIWPGNSLSRQSLFAKAHAANLVGPKPFAGQHPYSTTPTLIRPLPRLFDQRAQPVIDLAQQQVHDLLLRPNLLSLDPVEILGPTACLWFTVYPDPITWPMKNYLGPVTLNRPNLIR